MDETELEALVAAAEDEFLGVVTDELSAVRAEYLDGLDAATEIVAARFSVSSIRSLWQARVPTLLSSLRGIFRRSAQTVADTVDEPLPDGWEEQPLAAYERAVTPLLNAVGDHMAEKATASLAEGLNEGESVEQLKARLSSLFSSSGSELGPVRSSMIAATEATRAWNAGTLASARALRDEGTAVVKQWRTRGDDKVRKAHREVDGQLQLVDDPFTVGGTAMQYPGDPTAPASLTVNCRCVLAVTAATSSDQGDTVTASSDEDFQSRMPPQLKRYWLHGEGAAKIGWGTPGSFKRCVRELHEKFPDDTEGLCANLYHEATGHWPGEQKDATAAITQDYSGSGMIALIPSAEDAARLALADGEDEDQLHCTLYFLGDITEWSGESVAMLVDEATALASGVSPVSAKLFGVNQWNPSSDSPAWVWATGDETDEGGVTLGLMRNLAEAALDFAGLLDAVPEQHSPWVAHVTGAYDTTDAPRDQMVERCGPITFDRVRVAIGGVHYDIPLMGPEPEEEPVEEEPYMAPDNYVADWFTPEGTGLAFENQETGDGRIFSPGALYWEGGPWPLQYADEMLEGHMGAQLAGAIHGMVRNGDQIAGNGVLYTDRGAGWDVMCLLQQGAPLGVSVDLDDVTMELVDRSGGDALLTASLQRASFLHMPDGSWIVEGETAAEWTASGMTMAGASTRLRFFTESDGSLSLSTVLATFGAGPEALSAAAGDPDSGGTVLETQSSGDVLMRITRARVRGATMVTIPAYAAATIALSSPGPQAGYELAASTGDTQWEIIQAVRSSLTPLTAAEVAQALRLPVQTVRDHLARATEKGLLVRIARGLYVGPVMEAEAVTAAVSGSVDLPVATRDHKWDGDGATTRVFDWADGDTEKIGQAYFWRDPDADPATKTAWKLGYADVVDGALTIIPGGVSAALAAVNGARGGVDIPESDMADVRSRIEAVQAHVADALGDESGMAELEASAWTAMQDLPAMPAAWFKEPTAAELSHGNGGVHYKDGRIFGWVARAGEPHAGFAQKITIEGLGKIDTTHFLRQRFALDDGSMVRAGAFTMNAGHHRDGAECETASCQFDDTRFVAGIVTVGMNEGGMWFSGAAAPWLAEWDRQVFMACQPSYHMKKGPGGGWQLRAVLSVPVPGHSSPLLASAVAERAEMALAASAAMAQPTEEGKGEVFTKVVDDPGIIATLDYDALADAIVASQARAAQREADEAEELCALIAEGQALGKLDSITASDVPADGPEGEES